jgi:hypothetical protein
MGREVHPITRSLRRWIALIKLNNSAGLWTTSVAPTWSALDIREVACRTENHDRPRAHAVLLKRRKAHLAMHEIHRGFSNAACVRSQRHFLDLSFAPEFLLRRPSEWGIHNAHSDRG